MRGFFPIKKQNKTKINKDKERKRLSKNYTVCLLQNCYFVKQDIISKCEEHRSYRLKMLLEIIL